MNSHITPIRCIATSLLMCLLAYCPLLVHSQESAFNANHQQMALLPGNVDNVSIIDGKLYCYASRVMLVAQRSGEQLLGFWADTTYVKVDPEMEYVVRHPVTGDIYYTKRDKQERSFLYVCRPVDGKKPKAKKVKLNRMTVEHPVFSVDGNIMIFSSLEKRHSHGGYDLWYSRLEGDKWSKPVNMGNRINTNSDEVTPSIYRDCLLFASNGHAEDYGYFSIYSTRLLSEHVVGDTVGMLQIGRCRVQRLPAPLNSDDADDLDMNIDTVAGCGYWVSKRTDSDTDSQLYSFSGAIDGVLLWGRVTDRYDTPLAGVAVSARQHDLQVCNTYTDDEGFYKLYLQSNQYYDMSYRLDNYFVAFEDINTAKATGEYLISEARQDVVMERLPYGQRIYYNDLFGPNVDIELSESGIEQLRPLVQFLTDNPHTTVTLSLSNDLTDDLSFNNLLTEQRLHTIETYLMGLLPSSVGMTFVNLCGGQNGCSNASGLSRLVVVIEDNK